MNKRGRGGPADGTRKGMVMKWGAAVTEDIVDDHLLLN